MSQINGAAILPARETIVVPTAAAATADRQRWQAVLDKARFTRDELAVLLAMPDLRSRFAAQRLGMGRTEFWRSVYLFKIPHVRHSERVVTFRAIDLEAVKRLRLVTGAADERLLADGRRSS
jgi:hypothetical protein